MRWLLVLALAGCDVTDPEPWCAELVLIVPGYEEQVLDSLRATVHPDSLFIPTFGPARAYRREACP